MPVTAKLIQANMALAAPELQGQVWLQFSSVLSDAIVNWLNGVSSISIKGTTTGTAGAGTVVGKLFVVPQPLSVSAAMSAAQFLGFLAPNVSRAVGVGVANAFNIGAVYTGVSAGVGVGTDVTTRVTANPITLTKEIMQSAALSGFRGPLMPPISIALGNGISSLFLGAKGVGVVTGTPAPSPSTGISSCSVV